MAASEVTKPAIPTQGISYVLPSGDDSENDELPFLPSFEEMRIMSTTFRNDEADFRIWFKEFIESLTRYLT